MMIKNFRHACVQVKDLKRSLRFYRDILGLRVSKVLTLEGRYPEKLFNIKGIKLEYVKMRDPAQSKKSPPVFELHCWLRPKIKKLSGYNHISFTVKNAEEAYKKLKQNGVKVISKPAKAPDSGCRVFFARDPDGHFIEFVQDK